LDLEVYAGETVGIVGRNGSGKSTLLQLIAGTLQASTGNVEVHGRVAALLELGAGFNPEFNGRENVYLNAQVLGLRKREVDERFERITAFADIGDFIDQPVRTYSSGMLVRLAFAVAINTDPDILIIDEALAVGDEAFQRKCFARIEALKASGATILFVSHAAASVLQLCDRAVLLDAGERLLTGPPKAVVAHYQRLLHAPPSERLALREEMRLIDGTEGGARNPTDEPTTAGDPGAEEGVDVAFELPNIRAWPLPPDERLDRGLLAHSQVDYVPIGASIEGHHVVNAAGEEVNVLVPGRPYRIQYRVCFDRRATQVEFNMTIKSLEGIALYGASSHGYAGFLPEVSAGAVVHVEFAFESRLLPGTYYYNVGCQGITEVDSERGFLHRILDAGVFRIEARTTDRYKIGFYDLAAEPTARWQIRRPTVD
jgi:lipopolysaccharide transport system ATP-binding protein